MPPFLLIGLGNPGPDYSGHRHNVGFMAIEYIMDEYGFAKPAKKFGGLLSEGSIGTHKVYAFMPLGYMNSSGIPANKAASFYKIPLPHIIAIHDELDLPLGKLRVKQGGGAGGHNGLKSLDEHLGQDYRRVRVGIGHPGDKDMVSDYVLSDFAKMERAEVKKMLGAITKHVKLLISGDNAGFMTKVALETQEIKPKKQ